MNIGCVKEIKIFEFRVGVTPDHAKTYVHRGHTVYIEKGAGQGSGFSDEEYIEAGARILVDAKSVWDVSDMIMKVKEPLASEYPYFREGLIVFTYLHLAADRPLLDAMMSAKVKGVAYETLIERDGNLPLLKPMSEIAGRLSVQEGAKYLEKTYGGSGILLSGVPGTPKGNVVILGAGTVGENACKIAVGMGADVTVLDINMNRLKFLDEIYGGRIQTLASTDAAIDRVTEDADLVIGCVLIPGKKTPKILSKEHLKKMRQGSVIVDVAIDQGGCCETSRMTYHDDPIFIVDGIVHYCVGNMAGSVPRTSTLALNNYTQNYGMQIAEYGLEEACRRNSIIYSAVNTYDGFCTCKNVAEDFSLYYVPAIDLFRRIMV